MYEMLTIPTETNVNEFDEPKKEVPLVKCPSKWSDIASKNAPQTNLPTCLPSLVVKQKKPKTEPQAVKPTKPRPPTLRELVAGRNNVMILLRGLPGCGKTTFAKFLKSQVTDPNTVQIYSFNSYFEQKDGKYVFDGRRVKDAKYFAYSEVASMMKDRIPVVIVDDCIVTIADAKPYIEEAEKHKYDIEIVEVKTPWCNNIDELVNRCVMNGHNVSKEIIENMDQRWYYDMTIDSVRMFGKKTFKQRQKK